MKEYIKYKGKIYQVSIICVDGLFETMVFPVENGVVSGKEVYCYRTGNLYSSKYRYQDIFHHPERYMSSEAMLKYLKLKEEEFKKSKFLNSHFDIWTNI